MAKTYEGAPKNMSQDQENIKDVLDTSIKILRQSIDSHHCLVSSIMEKEIDDQKLRALLDFCPKRSRELKLEKAIQEAINVIEESRKAFKSKRLEALRKKLTQVLIDAG